MKRIQIQLTNKKLDDVVQEMAEAITHRLKGQNVPENDRIKVFKSSIREVLEKYVHAYDSCGLAAICHEASEVYPWSVGDQDKD